MQARGEGNAAKEFGVQTAHHGITYLTGETISSVISLVILLFLGNVLGQSSFGIFAIIIAFNTLLGAGGNFGVGTVFRKRLPQTGEKSRRDTILSSGYSISIVLGLVLSAVGVALSGLIATVVYHNAALTPLLQLASGIVFFTMLYNVSLAALVGLGRVSEAAAANVIYAVVQLIGVFGLVLLGYGVFGAVVGVALSFIVPSLYEVFVLFRKASFKAVMPVKKEVKAITEFSMPVAVSHIAQFGAENFAILLLGAFVATSLVGNYNVAFRIGRFVQIIFISNTFILLPAFAKVFAKESLAKKIDIIYNNSIYYTLLFLLPVVAFLTAVSVPLMHTLFPGYNQTPLFFAIVALGTTLGIIGTYAGTLILSYGDVRKFMKYQVAAVAVEVGLLLLLTPTYGAMGALAALFVISPIVLDFIYIRALHNQFKFGHGILRLLRLVIPAAILFAVSYYVAVLLHQGALAMLVDFIVVILGYPAMVGLIRGITKDEMDFLRSVGKTNRLLGLIANYILDYTQFFLRQ